MKILGIIEKEHLQTEPEAQTKHKEKNSRMELTHKQNEGRQSGVKQREIVLQQEGVQWDDHEIVRMITDRLMPI